MAIRTVIAIAVTPFDEDGRIDEEAFRSLIARTASAGVSAITVNGNTSEFYSLCPAERRRAVGLAAASSGDAVVIAGVGLDVETAIQEAALAHQAGAGCVMVHQPIHPFQSLHGWVDYHRRIHEAVPQVGLVPYVKDPRVGIDTMGLLFDACPSVVGVKYAVADPAAFASMVRALGDERVTWLCGLAETWAPFFAVAGAAGFTSGLVSVDPDRSLRLHRALVAGDRGGAMREWDTVSEFEALRTRDRSELNVSVIKEALSQLGLCRPDVRPPITVLRPADRAAVAGILASWKLSTAA